ncbi:hypothetical protein ZWY2020_014708 [Hordeum vulgare]|nr:hypothetical protein ZWY2020_014708 [Hordeum vulgare]
MQHFATSMSQHRAKPAAAVGRQHPNSMSARCNQQQPSLAACIFCRFHGTEEMDVGPAPSEPQRLRVIGPHSFEFPSKLESANVLSCPPVGIGPSRSLLEMSNSERKFRLFSAAGITPVRRLTDKSSTCSSKKTFGAVLSDSSIGISIKALGICPVRLLFDISRWKSKFRLLIQSGIGPVS